MGLAFTQLWLRMWGSKEMRTLMLGLDIAGKTVEHKNICFMVGDVSGQDKIRPLWHRYYQGTQGLIFVVDSNDCDRAEDARGWELMKMLNEDEIGDAVVSRVR